MSEKITRAWATFEIKAIDEEKRIIQGIASTPTTDRQDDIVEPLGAEFMLPLPFLWQHDSWQPIGHVIAAKPNKNGIPVTIQIADIEESGRLKSRLDEAWQSIKIGLVRGLSIGFSVKESIDIDGTWGRRFTKWEWLELSAVTIAANAEASITSIKSIDKAVLRAASGANVHRVVTLGKTPGDTGKTKEVKSALNLKGITDMGKPVSEQITAFEAKRAASVGRMDEIMSAAADTGSSLDAAQAEEHDTLKAEVKAIDEHLVRLKDHLALQAKAKSSVVIKGDEQNADDLAGARGGRIISVKSNLPKGTGFTRFALAMAQSKGNIMHAAEIAKKWKEESPEVLLAIKAVVDPGTTTDPAWAGALVHVQQMADEFIELLRPQTIIGRIPNFRRVPFNVKMPRQLTGSTAAWVGQGAPKPVSELSFDSVTLGFAKVAGIVVITEELARLSSPSAEAVVRQDMIEVMTLFQDQQFITPTVTAVANVSPASITNGAPTTPSTGYTVANVTDDVTAMIGAFIAANINLATAVWVMNPRTALSLSVLRSSSEDTFAFPGITPQGGTFFGLPVITSNAVPVAGTSGNPTIIVLMNASDILLADDGGINLDVSREASLQMDDAPETGATSLVSLWQNNLIGLRAERMINWFKRRPAAVQVMTGVTY